MKVCAECGDIGCGATTFQLKETKDEIIRSAFGDQNDYENTFDTTGYKNVEPFVLKKKNTVDYLLKI